MATRTRTILPIGMPRKGKGLEYFAAAGSLLILAITTFAFWKGWPAVDKLPLPVTVHLFSLLPVLILTPIMFIGSKGVVMHRVLGWIWSILMLVTAIATIFIRSPEGNFSLIHIFTVITLLSVPRLLFNARKHRVQQHRWAVLGLVYGALLIAGSFAFVGNRFLAQSLYL
jgi:uncharacterized membrane protein